MENGKGYVVVVHATDFVGLIVEETSNEFIVDETAPIPGWVSIVSPSPKDFNMTQVTSRYDVFT